jgi:ParB-like nuclease domain
VIPVPPKRRAGRARLRLFGPAAAQSERSARVFVTGRRSREGLSAARRGESNMANAVAKIKLSPSRDIPFNKLVLSQANVRRVKAGVSIEQLAESIALRTLLQSLNVRAILDADGKETGMFEVPAGGRRYRALELLVNRIELSGFTDAMRDRLSAYGLFHEIISWKLRMFVPIDTGGVGLLSKVLERYPVARIAERAA